MAVKCKEKRYGYSRVLPCMVRHVCFECWRVVEYKFYVLVQTMQLLELSVALS
jgi:hypothetical protein